MVSTDRIEFLPSISDYFLFVFDDSTLAPFLYLSNLKQESERNPHETLVVLLKCPIIFYIPTIK